MHSFTISVSLECVEVPGAQQVAAAEEAYVAIAVDDTAFTVRKTGGSPTRSSVREPKLEKGHPRPLRKKASLNVATSCTQTDKKSGTDTNDRSRLCTCGQLRVPPMCT